MPISNSYRKDTNIQDEDLILGVKASNNITVNFPAQSVVDYLNVNSKISIAGQMSFMFTITPFIPKTIAFDGGMGNNTPFANITELIISGADLTGNSTAVFMDYLVGTDILLMQQNNSNYFGHYKIISYTQIGTTGFYTLVLDFIGGNGNILNETYYDICSLVLSGGSGSTPNLQQVTDVGNETTDNVIFRANNNQFVKINSTDGLLEFWDLNIISTQPNSVFGNNGFVLGSSDLTGVSQNQLNAYFTDSSSYLQFTNTLGWNMILDFNSGSSSNDGTYFPTYKFRALPTGDYDIAVTSDLTGYVQTSRTLTINGTSYDLSTNRSWSVGDLVSSGSYADPPWITSLAYSKLTGAPIIPTVGTWGALNYPTWTTGTPFVKMTAAGTFALDTTTYLSSISSSDVTTALGYTPVTNARTLTINGVGYDLTADRSWTIATGTGTVTSVGMTVPSAFSVTPSSITTSGTFAITGAGVASQYVRGDGTLANFPTSTGGGASVSYYLNGSVSQGTLGGVAYKGMNSIPIIGTGTDFTINADGYIAQFITDVGDPNKLLIPAGNWNFETYFSASSGGGSPRFYIELYKYNGATFTLITSNSTTPENITGGTAIDLYFTAISVPPTTLLATDRLAVRFYVIHSGRTITMHTENSHLSQIITTFSTGLNDLNGLTSQAQYFATGTTGTDFAIVSTGTSHTFNLPNASATARGVITTEVQTLAGAKTFSTAPILSSLTASQILALDASKNIQTLDTATYPSLTELSYVKGVTSSIQTQFNNLAFSQSGLTAYTGTITWSGTTAPSGTTNFSYNWTKIGNMVTLNISLLYGTAGTLVSSVVMTLPAGAPTPIKPTGFSGASNLLYQASGKMSNSVTSTTVVNSHAVLRSNAANNGFEIYVGQTTGTNTLATATVIYFTA